MFDEKQTAMDTQILEGVFRFRAATRFMWEIGVSCVVNTRIATSAAAINGAANLFQAQDIYRLYAAALPLP